MRLPAALGALALTLLFPGASAAQTSILYVTAGAQNRIFAVQGGTVLDSWTTAYSGTEYPIAVSGGTIRTVGYQGALPEGGEYLLDGTPTGAVFTNPVGDYMYDGTSDGSYSFVVEYFDRTVWRTDTDFSNPQALFSAAVAGTHVGITYDPLNGSLWIAPWDHNAVYNYAMDGTLLSSFSTPENQLGALALDPADGTLWTYRRTFDGDFYQFSRDGDVLQQVHVDGMAGMNVLGGEFDMTAAPNTTVPEPGTVVLLGTGLLGLAAAGARRRRSGVATDTEGPEETA